MFSFTSSSRSPNSPEVVNAHSGESDTFPYEDSIAEPGVNTQSSNAAPKSSVTVKGRTYQLVDLGISPEFLQALPEEIQEELLSQAVESLSNKTARSEQSSSLATSQKLRPHEPPSSHSTKTFGAAREPGIQPSSSFGSRSGSPLGNPLSPNDVYIAVMGITGSGKSTFISKLVGDDVRVGHELQSCTAEVYPYSFMYSPTQRVFLLDTPGFDDTNRSDTDVLKDVATFLSRMYAGNIKLAGIIYLHRITDNRMGGSAMRNLRMFKKLCGDEYFRNIILATTMWERLQTHSQGERNESQLLAERDWWGGMHEKGSKVFRHMDTVESAMDVITYLVNRRPAVLRIQEEMVDEHRDLVDTSAGKEVEKDLQELRMKFVSEIQSLREEQIEALQERDEFMANELKQQQEKMEQQLIAADKAREDLKVDFERLAQDQEKKHLNLIKEQQRVIHEARKRAEIEARRERKRQEAEAQQERDRQEQERIRWQTEIQSINQRFEKQARIDREQREDERRRWQQEISDRDQRYEEQKRRERERQDQDRQEREQLQKSFSKLQVETDDRSRPQKNYKRGGSARSVRSVRSFHNASPVESDDDDSTLSGTISISSLPAQSPTPSHSEDRDKNQRGQRPDTRKFGTGASLLIAMAGIVTLNPLVAMAGIGGAMVSSQME